MNDFQSEISDFSKRFPAARSILVLSRPRSGSTAVVELLGSHPIIENLGEPMNNTIHQNLQSYNEDQILDYLFQKLSAKETKKKQEPKWKVFKLHTDQIVELGVSLRRIIHHCGIEKAIVVWRQDMLECIASSKIAFNTGEWYKAKDEVDQNQNENGVHSCDIHEESLRWRIDEDKRIWIELFKEWPLEIQPVFIQYEWLFGENGRDGRDEAKIAERFRKVFQQLSVYDWPNARCYSAKQNPAPVEQKVTNWSQLPEELRSYKADVPELFRKTISTRVGIPLQMLPDPEPAFPSGVIRHRVAEPYIPQASITYVNQALHTTNISSAGTWPKVLAQKLQQLFDVPVAIPCSNGFMALVLALRSADIGAGDDVIVPTFTMVAVSNAVHFVGARPVFVDNSAELEDYNPCWKQIEQVATDMTRAVICTHTYGCPVKGIQQIADNCKRNGWTLIEDISECVGIRADDGGRLLGTYGDYAAASLYANKIVHAGDGGFVLARDRSKSSRLFSLLNHGFTRTYHFVHPEPAVNAKINGLGAAVACGVLEHLEEIMDHRNRLAQWYRTELEPLVTPSHLRALMPKCGPNDTPWVFGIVCNSKPQRTSLRKHLAQRGIETRDYFFPLHLQPFSKHKPLQFGNAEAIAGTGLYLPTHMKLTEQIITNEICAAIHEFFKLHTTYPQTKFLERFLD